MSGDLRTDGVRLHAEASLVQRAETIKGYKSPSNKSFDSVSRLEDTWYE